MVKAGGKGVKKGRQGLVLLKEASSWHPEQCKWGEKRVCSSPWSDSTGQFRGIRATLGCPGGCSALSELVPRPVDCKIYFIQGLCLSLLLSPLVCAPLLVLRGIFGGSLWALVWGTNRPWSLRAQSICAFSKCTGHGNNSFFHPREQLVQVFSWNNALENQQLVGSGNFLSFFFLLSG